MDLLTLVAGFMIVVQCSYHFNFAYIINLLRFPFNILQIDENNKNLKINFTQNKKHSTDDNENSSFVCYTTFYVILFFIKKIR